MPTVLKRACPERIRECDTVRTWRVIPLLLGATVSLLASCGGAQTSSRPAPEVDPEEATQRAADAWGQLDAEGAARHAHRALEAGGGTVAREIAARANLALGRHEAAIAALEGSSSPMLLRLRARAQIANGDYPGAALTLERVRRDEDPWTEAVTPAITALGGRPPYEVRGDRAEIPLEELGLPVVRVRIDAVETLAVIGSATHFMVVDPSVRANPGVIDELALGAMEVAHVPHTVRSLSAVGEALGAPIGAVIGSDLLLRLHATLDGPGRRLVVRAESGVSDGGTSARWLLLTGSFLAVEAEIGGRPAWLTLDTAGGFPVALAPDADEALGLSEEEWTALPADAGPDLRALPTEVHLGALHVEGIPVVMGLLGEDHARATGAPVAGSVGWGLLGQLVVRFDREGRRLHFE